jgi:large-conductance mechanosensitive channel
MAWKRDETIEAVIDMVVVPFVLFLIVRAVVKKKAA